MKYGRQPQYFWKWKTTSNFSIGRQPQFSSRQPKKRIFGVQPYFDPTRWNMEDDLNIFKNGRRPQFFQMDDDLNLVLGNPRTWFSVCNLILTQLDEIWKTTSIFLKMEDDLDFCQMDWKFRVQSIIYNSYNQRNIHIMLFVWAGKDNLHIIFVNWGCIFVMNGCYVLKDRVN